MNLSQVRHAIRPLLNAREPADAMDEYYAFHHPDRRTTLISFPREAARASGYLALSQTGLDLFRPLLTTRVPSNPEDVASLLYDNIPPGSGLFIGAPESYRPWIDAFFEVQREQLLRLFRLEYRDFKPVVNVLVTEANTQDGLPRYVVRTNSGDGTRIVGAWAGLNWQSPRFAEIAVGTQPKFRQRGWGRSVVASLSQHVLKEGRTPLYLATENNEPSISLARSLGFRDTGARRLLLEATLRPLQP